MCLFAAPDIHPTKKPRIAGYDILCWKVMNHVPEGASFSYSPYLKHIWHFGEAETATLGLPPRGNNCLLVIVEEGLHAFVHKKSAEARADIRSKPSKAYPAIIPAGTKFFIGCGGNPDIVAEKMTVYPTLEEALKGRTYQDTGNLSLHTEA
jgi:hypothetical protein